MMLGGVWILDINPGFLCLLDLLVELKIDLTGLSSIWKCERLLVSETGNLDNKRPHFVFWGQYMYYVRVCSSNNPDEFS